MSHSSYFLLVEIDGIQRFVFVSPALKDVRGGSCLLDHFNRCDMVEIGKQFGAEPVFVGGGHALLSGFVSIAVAEKAAQEMQHCLSRRTEFQVRLSYGIAEDQKDFQALMRTLRADQRHRESHESKTGFPGSLIPAPLPPFVAMCGYCGQSPAQHFAKGEEEEGKPICGACESRRDASDKMGKGEIGTVWRRLRPLLSSLDQSPWAIPGTELGELVAHASGKQYLAYLYCDGNAMGSRLSNLKNVNEYARFSKMVDDALHYATACAIREHCMSSTMSGENRNIGAQILMLGGDDLIIALRADRAIDFTTTLLEQFYAYQQNHADRQGFLPITLSAGLVFSEYKFPISLLQETAHALLKSAKKLAYLDQDSRIDAHGYIDFQEITASHSSLDRQHITSCKPYRLHEFKRLSDAVRDLKRADVPRGRLHALAEAIGGSVREAATISRIVVGRAKKDQPQALRRAMYPPLDEFLESQVPSVPAFFQNDNALPPEMRIPANPGFAKRFDYFSTKRRWSPIPDALELLDHLTLDGGGMSR